tara:strand:+ start:177 stop:914 length:738 start_codon:yes stop_codon:yes gene_type:complete
MSVETLRQAPMARPSMSTWKRLRRVGHHGLRAATVLGIIAVAVVAIGFFRFTDMVGNLDTPRDSERFDAIVALTGGYQRIDRALELLEGGSGKRLLISGVNPQTSGTAIKRVTGANEKLFACCVDIGYQAIDTIGNANEAANWIRKNGFHKVLIVTNNYHIPRSLMELEAVSPDVEFTGYPVAHTDLRDETWLADPMAIRTLLTEYFKYALASARAYVGTKTSDGLRSGAPEPVPAAAATSAAVF